MTDLPLTSLEETRSYAITRRLWPEVAQMDGRPSHFLVRTAVDGMLHFDPALGFDAVNDAAHWSDTSNVVVADMPGTLVDLDAFDSPAVLDVEDTAAVVTTLAD